MPAALSAIMMAGGLVSEEVIFGNPDASTTRSPATPCTRNSGSTTAMPSVPIVLVPTGWQTVLPNR